MARLQSYFVNKKSYSLQELLNFGYEIDINVGFDEKIEFGLPGKYFDELGCENTYRKNYSAYKSQKFTGKIGLDTEIIEYKKRLYYFNRVGESVGDSLKNKRMSYLSLAKLKKMVVVVCFDVYGQYCYV